VRLEETIGVGGSFQRSIRHVGLSTAGAFKTLGHAKGIPRISKPESAPDFSAGAGPLWAYEFWGGLASRRGALFDIKSDRRIRAW